MFIRLLLFLILLLNSLTSISFSSISDDISAVNKDKYIHFSAGVLISHLSYPFFKKYRKTKKNTWFYSFSLAVIASIGKEVYDKNRTGFNYSDILAGTLGGLTIAVVDF
jgi:TRAP-type uncharacterized transport system fused permease subunit